MKLSATREQILAPLQSVIGVVERRQTMPVLSNVLLAARNNRISITGTDLEVELVASADATVQQPGDVTVPGRKLFDIFKALPDKTPVTVATDGERVTIKAGKSRFTLSSLPASENGRYSSAKRRASGDPSRKPCVDLMSRSAWLRRSARGRSASRRPLWVLR